MTNYQKLSFQGKRLRSLGFLLACLWAAANLAETPAAGQSVATYDLTVTNSWTQANHESWAVAFDTIHDPHFSHLGGGTHNSSLTMWETGGLSSPGMIYMQETGWVDDPNTAHVDLQTEFDTHLANGSAYSFLNYPQPFAPSTSTTLSFEVSSTHPLVSLVTMIGPSPDWFVGVSGLDMRAGNLWRDTISVDLYVHNGGTRSNDEGFLCCANGPLESPQKVISLFAHTPNVNDPLRSALTADPIGTFVFELQSIQGQPGDQDGDDDVDGGDFLTWQRNPTAGTLSAWQTHYGAPAAGAVSHAVPEPTALGLTLFGLGLFGLRLFGFGAKRTPAI